MSLLDSSAVQFEAYKKANIALIVDALLASSKANHIVSLGIESAFLDYQIVIEGTPDGHIMNEIQTQYFAETTEYFLNFSIENYAVFALEVENQDLITVDSNRRRIQMGKGLVTITGCLLGAYPSVSSVHNFRKSIEEAFQERTETYVDLLKGNVIRPGRISSDPGISYFLDITSAKGNITVKRVSSKKSKSFVGAVVIGAVMGAFIVTGSFLLFSHIKREQKKRRDLALWREHRRKERHARRLEQFTKVISVKSLDVGSLNAISDGGKRHDPTSEDSSLYSIPYPAIKDPLHNFASSSMTK